ncbi:MAG: hypothetical protein AAGF98_14430 [Cyanobacteria bacterium P01_H01_bin.153]
MAIALSFVTTAVVESAGLLQLFLDSGGLSAIASVAALGMMAAQPRTVAT